MQGRENGITTQNLLFTFLSRFAAREVKSPTASPLQALGRLNRVVTGIHSGWTDLGSQHRRGFACTSQLVIISAKLLGTPLESLQPN